jgi:adenylosuccinate lyase
MATENLLMAAVKAGGDRQDLHERIRRHSQEAAHQIKQEGKPNDLLARIKRDDAFRHADFTFALSPLRYVGRSIQQVEEFIKSTVDPIRQRYTGKLQHRVRLKV